VTEQSMTNGFLISCYHHAYSFNASVAVYSNIGEYGVELLRDRKAGLSAGLVMKLLFIWIVFNGVFGSGVTDVITHNYVLYAIVKG